MRFGYGSLILYYGTKDRKGQTMGLDQYAYARPIGTPSNGGENNEELTYWCKHNRLHGWMERLYVKRGNELGQEAFGNDFNCIELELTESDIEQLEAHIQGKSLPATGGFFFGDDSYEDYEEYRKENDLDFITNARKAFSEGKKVYYNSWW